MIAYLFCLRAASYTPSFPLAELSMLHVSRHMYHHPSPELMKDDVVMEQRKAKFSSPI